MAGQDPTARARKLFQQVKQGKVIFFKAGNAWDILGPAALVQSGDIVTVTKANGETTQVMVLDIMAERTVDGVATRTATFTTVRAGAGTPIERPWYPVRDRQAAAVGGALGLTSPAKLGYCHYCGLELDHNGSCPECR